MLQLAKCHIAHNKVGAASDLRVKWCRGGIGLEINVRAALEEKLLFICAILLWSHNVD